MVECKYVFTQRIAKALHSETAFVAGINKTSFTREVMCDTRDSYMADMDLKCYWMSLNESFSPEISVYFNK